MEVLSGGIVIFKTPSHTIVFSKDALETFAKFRQRRCWHREAGGQLFARVTGKSWLIETVTGPRVSDLRSRFLFKPNRREEQAEINRYFESQLHFVGDWHTHPEDEPKPSADDTRSIANIVRESTYQINGLLLCIVGRARGPRSIWLSFHRRDGTIEVAELVE